VKAYSLIRNEISDVVAYVFSLFETQIYICISAVQDGVIASAQSVIVQP
jgi:hypothetical protein